MEESQIQLTLSISKVLDVIKSIDKRLIELEHKENIKNKYYNDGELSSIHNITDELHKIMNELK